MLEKIGLPAKPSLRGNNWVVDASNCQGCNSQFTFINRKHHCRRCGGIFCGSCTQQRMLLRGQGDSPVRICEPCKKLEEAARFELRHGLKSRASRGASKQISKHEDQVLNKILDDLGNGSVSSGQEAVNMQRAASSASCSSVEVTARTEDGHDHMSSDTVSSTPEELRQQAVEEKKKYKILKAEGKPDEALRAFKRGKELERQAGALEIELRKNRKKTLSSIMTNEMPEIKDNPSRTSKKNDDLASELRELGWSDFDLQDSDKKPVTMSLEGELSNLLGEVSHKPKTVQGTQGIDKSEVIALKKRALTLKREGRLSEAKEELKKAKILEKKIEEQELLGCDEDSDEEFSSLLKSMEIDKETDFTTNHDFKIDHVLSLGDDVDGNFDVTDEDMYDPDINSALKSLGWDEDSDSDEILGQPKNSVSQPAKSSSKPDAIHKLPPKSKLAIQRELLALKKKALGLRREGKIDEADEELKKGKVLEQQLEEMDRAPKLKEPHIGFTKKQVDVSEAMDAGVVEADVTDQDMHDPSYLSLLQNLGWNEDDERAQAAPAKEKENTSSNILIGMRRSKGEIQRELLGLKRKALALRRQGEMGEAEEILKAASVVEDQLVEMEAPKQVVSAESEKHSKNEFEAEKSVVRIQFQGEAPESKFIQEKENPCSSIQSVASRSKGEIQRELLGLKRKALDLRRQGEMDEADEILKTASVLEDQLVEMEARKQVSAESDKHGKNEVKAEETVVTMQFQEEAPESKSIQEIQNTSSSIQIVASRSKGELQRELIDLKRKALALRRQGEMDEADEVLKTGSIQEDQLVEMEVLKQVSAESEKERKNKAKAEETAGRMQLQEQAPESKSSQVEVEHENRDVGVGETGPVSQSNTLKQEILAHKRKAVSLKREGKLAEAKEELRKAKLLEKSITEDTSPESKPSSSKVTNPDAASSSGEKQPNKRLSSNITSSDVASSIGKKEQNLVSPPKLSSRDRFKLQQESLGHKRQALKLRREGRVEEAEAEFELAKALEAQLEEQEPARPSAEPVDDAVIEDFLDPQLLSALREIGLGNAGTLSHSPEKVLSVKQVAAHSPEKVEPLKRVAAPIKNSNEERIQLEEEIKAEKLKALNLKRSGKQAEALDALRRAKLLEKKLNSLGS